MIRRRPAWRSLRILFAALILSGSASSPGAVFAAPAADTFESAAPLAGATTTTKISAPAWKYRDEDLYVRVSVSPIPNGGRARISSWSDATGGSRYWLEERAVDPATGVASFSAPIMPIGVSWLQAEFLGTDSYSPSQTAERTPIDIRLRPMRITVTSTDLVADQGQWLGFQYTLDPVPTWSGGWVTITANGDPIGTAWADDTGTIVPGVPLPTGVYEIRAKYAESEMYSEATSAAITQTIGNVTPAPGTFTIDYGASATNKATVKIRIAANDSVGAVEEVRIANDGTVTDGLLAAGRTFAYSSVLDWSLSDPPCACDGDGRRTVWVQWRRADGEWSTPIARSIYYDTAAPAGTVAINGDAPTFGDPWVSGVVHDQVLSLRVSDQPGTPAPRRWSVSNDGIHWFDRRFPSTGFGDYEHLWNPVVWTHTGTEDGPRQEWVRWQDAAGNWSATARDTIVLRNESVGRVIFNGIEQPEGATTTDSAIVWLEVPVDVVPPTGVKSVSVSNGFDNPRKAFPYSDDMIIRWSLTDPTYGGFDGDGIRSVLVWWHDNAGRTSQRGQVNVYLDRSATLVAEPRQLLTLDSSTTQTSSATVSTDVRWTPPRGTSATVGYEAQQSTDGASWQTVPLAATRTPLAIRAVTSGHNYRFRTRTLDGVSTWKTGSSFQVRPVSDKSSAISYSGTWRSESRTSAIGGSLKYSTTRRASATFSFTGMGFAWVAPRGPIGATASISVDGVYAGSFPLYSVGGYEPRRVIFSRSWKSAGSHRVKIWKDMEDDFSQLVVDGFVVLKPPDTTAPVASPPTQDISRGSGATVAWDPATGIAGVPIDVRWPAASDSGGSGVAGYELARSVNGSGFATIQYGSSRSRRITVKPGSIYQFRVRVRDGAGNWSSPRYGPRFLVRAYQETSGAVAYAGGWYRTSATSLLWGGYAKWASGSGATAKVTVNGAVDVAWVSTGGPTMGSANIVVDGVAVKAADGSAKVFDLYGSTAAYRRIVYSRTVSASSSHTLSVKVLGTVGHPRVDVDAFIALIKQ